MPSQKRQRKRQNAQLRHQALASERRRADFRRRVITGVVILAVFAAIVGLITAVNSGDDGTDVATGTDTTRAAASSTTTTEPERTPAVEPTCPPTDGSAETHQRFTGPFDSCIEDAKTYTADVETDVGTFTITFDDEKAPKTVDNFVSLARYHYFDGIVFHRVIPGFVVQGGDPTGTGSGGPGYEFDDELPQQGEYEIGSVAMANSGPDTNGSQFFVVTGDQGVQLPPSYSLFGKVTAGMDVVKKIEADGAPSGTPKVLHRIVKVTIKEA